MVQRRRTVLWPQRRRFKAAYTSSLRPPTLVAEGLMWCTGDAQWPQCRALPLTLYVCLLHAFHTPLHASYTPYCGAQATHCGPSAALYENMAHTYNRSTELLLRLY